MKKWQIIIFVGVMVMLAAPFFSDAADNDNMFIDNYVKNKYYKIDGINSNLTVDLLDKPISGSTDWVYNEICRKKVADINYTFEFVSDAPGFTVDFEVLNNVSTNYNGTPGFEMRYESAEAVAFNKVKKSIKKDVCIPFRYKMSISETTPGLWYEYDIVITNDDGDIIIIDPWVYTEDVILNLPSPSNSYRTYTDATHTSMATSFLVNRSGTTCIGNVSLSLYGDGSTLNNIDGQVRIYASTNNYRAHYPTGSILAQSEIVDLSDVPANACSWKQFRLDTPVCVDAYANYTAAIFFEPNITYADWCTDLYYTGQNVAHWETGVGWATPADGGDRGGGFIFYEATETSQNYVKHNLTLEPWGRTNAYPLTNLSCAANYTSNNQTMNMTTLLYMDGVLNQSQTDMGYQNGTLNITYFNGVWVPGKNFTCNITLNTGVDVLLENQSNGVLILNSTPLFFNSSIVPSVTRITSTINATANITNNGSSTMTINYSLYVNGVLNQSIEIGGYVNGTLNTTSFQGRWANEDSLYVNITANDSLGGYVMNQTPTLTVAGNIPTITLDSPANNTAIENVNYTIFQYLAIDDDLDLMTCNLTLDSVLINSSPEVSSGTTIKYNYTFTGNNRSILWNVTCDDGLNISHSNTYNVSLLADTYGDTPTFINTTFIDRKIHGEWTIIANVNSTSRLEYINLTMTAPNGSLEYDNTTMTKMYRQGDLEVWNITYYGTRNGTYQFNFTALTIATNKSTSNTNVSQTNDIVFSPQTITKQVVGAKGDLMESLITVYSTDIGNFQLNATFVIENSSEMFELASITPNNNTFNSTNISNTKEYILKVQSNDSGVEGQYKGNITFVMPNTGWNYTVFTTHGLNPPSAELILVNNSGGSIVCNGDDDVSDPCIISESVTQGGSAVNTIYINNSGDYNASGCNIVTVGTLGGKISSSSFSVLSLTTQSVGLTFGAPNTPGVAFSGRIYANCSTASSLGFGQTSNNSIYATYFITPTPAASPVSPGGGGGGGAAPAKECISDVECSVFGANYICVSDKCIVDPTAGICNYNGICEGEIGEDVFNCGDRTEFNQTTGEKIEIVGDCKASFASFTCSDPTQPCLYTSRGFIGVVSLLAILGLVIAFLPKKKKKKRR